MKTTFQSALDDFFDAEKNFIAKQPDNKSKQAAERRYMFAINELYSATRTTRILSKEQKTKIFDALDGISRWTRERLAEKYQ